MCEPLTRPGLQFHDSLPCQGEIQPSEEVITPDCAQHLHIYDVRGCNLWVGI